MSSSLDKVTIKGFKSIESLEEFELKALNVTVADVNAIVEACGEPEKINNSRETAPSKRLNNLKTSGKFKKTTEGITIAEQIGIDKMRARCPLFNEWLNKIEATMEAVAGDENEA